MIISLGCFFVCVRSLLNFRGLESLIRKSSRIGAMRDVLRKISGSTKVSTKYSISII